MNVTGKCTPTLLLLCVAIGLCHAALPRQSSGEESTDFLSWNASRCQSIGKAMYVRGRVGGLFGFRGLKTERAANYKLAATWLTPEVIRATARLAQIRSRISDEGTLALVAQAGSARETVIMIELDPREGSGVIPRDWEAFLGPKRKGHAVSQVRGLNKPELSEVRSLGGVLRRNYDYDRFWVVFPLVRDDGTPLFENSDVEAELLVRIHDQEGRVGWRIPDSIRLLGR